MCPKSFRTQPGACCATCSGDDPPPRMNPTDFAASVLYWFHQHGRHHLPWQQNASPYRVWVSEIMLQQTQVATVIPYFERFMTRFPDIGSLAQASVDEVLHLWTGLGYYARARNLHHCAQILWQHHQGSFPASVAALSALPGIGQSTAGAILSLGLKQRACILDGNVKRVLCRHFAILGWAERSDVKRRLWALTEELTPLDAFADYNQAMMDLGATVCTRSKPACGHCPLQHGCKALRQNRIADFPERKPARQIPVRMTLMLMCVDSTETPTRVLLEKRPSTGIWGGLWSLPECEDTAAVDRFCQQFPGLVQGLDPVRRQSWEPLRHSFSHFHLDIHPLEIPARVPHCGIMDSSRWLWYPVDSSLAVGLAAPVKRLLLQLATTNKESKS